MTDLKETQLQLEAEMFDGGIARMQATEDRAIKSGAASETMYNRKLIKDLIAPLVEGIQAYKGYYEGRRGSPSRALKYLRCVPDEASAYIALKVTLDLCQTDVTLPSIAMTIGERIEDQVRFTKLEGAAAKYFGKVQDSLKKNATASYKHKHRVLVAAEKRIVANDKEGEAERWATWPKADLGLIGFQLLDIIENTLTFEGEPIFSREVVSAGGVKQKARLKVSPSISKWSEEYREHISQLAPCFGPCVVPPRNWETPFKGGFHTAAVASKLQLVKGKRKHVKKLTKQQMPLVYEGINALQAVPWQINKEVLEVATMVANKDLGYAIPSFAPVIDKDNKPACPVPECYSDLKGQELKAVLTDKEWADFMAWKSDCSRLYTSENKRSSKALATSRQIGQARKYADFEEIFFVYSLDSRGRVYSQSSVLNPQSSDLGKAMLRSAHGETLNAEGYREFCITGANLFGYDKDTEDEKVEKSNAEDFIEMCIDIKADPMTFRDWVGADEPWEFLAWALEFAEYHELKEEGRESEFKTKLPNGRDGSCSGIQHYSAMMHDEVGGAAVNLVPSNSHQDIYRKVAETAIDKCVMIQGGKELDFGAVKVDGRTLLDEHYNPIERIPLALQMQLATAWINIGITRGMTKKPVMTLPYGSSQLTCREAILDYLDALQETESKKALNEGRDANPVHPFGDKGSLLPLDKALSFMTKIVWSSIGEVVKAPVVAMKFIKKLTLKVVKANKALMWTTPTGLIVHQEIFEQETSCVKTKLMGMSKFTLVEETDQIDRAGMQAAAAPNFVHSYDASHLLLSVVSMHRAGFKFIHVIHDDFGTLANGTPKLQWILRDEMIKMYKEFNRLRELLEENETRLEEEFDLEVPPQYDLDLEVVRESKSAFA